MVGVEILQQCNDISDHYLVLRKHHLAKAVNSTPCYNFLEPSLLPQKTAY